MADIIAEDLNLNPFPDAIGAAAPVVVPRRKKIVPKGRGRTTTSDQVPTPPPQETSKGRMAAAALARGGGSVIGSVLPWAGAALGTLVAPGPGTAAGTALGYGLGFGTGAASELVGQALEENVPISQIPGKIFEYAQDPKRASLAGFEGGMTLLPGKAFVVPGKVAQSMLRAGATTGAGEAIRTKLRGEDVGDNKARLAMTTGAGALTGGLLGKFIPPSAVAGTPKKLPMSSMDELMQVSGDPDAFRANLPSVLQRGGWGSNLDRIMTEADKLAANEDTKDLANTLLQVALQYGHWEPKTIQAEIDRLMAKGLTDKAISLATAAVESRKDGGIISKWLTRTTKERATAAAKQQLLESKKTLTDKKIDLVKKRLEDLREGSKTKKKGSIKVSETDPVTGETLTHVEEIVPGEEQIDDLLGGSVSGGGIPDTQLPPPGTAARNVYDAWLARGMKPVAALRLTTEGNIPSNMMEEMAAAPIAPTLPPVNTPEGASAVSAIQKAWGISVPKPKPVAPQKPTPPLTKAPPAAVNEEEAAVRKSLGLVPEKKPSTPKLTAEQVEKLKNLAETSPRVPQPFVPISLEGELPVGKAAQGAVTDAGLVNPNIDTTSIAAKFGGTKSTPEPARDAAVEQLNRRLTPDAPQVGGRRASDSGAVPGKLSQDEIDEILITRATQEPWDPTKSAAYSARIRELSAKAKTTRLTPEEMQEWNILTGISAPSPVAPKIVEEALPDLPAATQSAPIVQAASDTVPNLESRLAALEAGQPPVAPQIASVADTDTGRTSGPLKAARKRATQLIKQIKDTMSQREATASGTPENKALAKQASELQRALADVRSKITELENATPPPPQAPPTLPRGPAPAKFDPSQTMSREEIQEIADSVMNARTGEIGAWEATKEWRESAALYYAAKARGDKFVPDPRGGVDPGTGQPRMISMSELGARISKGIPAQLEADGIIPAGFAQRVKQEIQQEVDTEARRRWQEGVSPAPPRQGSEGAVPVTVGPEASTLPGPGAPVEVPQTGPTMPVAADIVGDVSPELSQRVEAFRRGVLDGSIPADQAAQTESALQRELLEAAAKSEGGTVLGSGFGGIQGLIERNPQFAIKAAMIAGGALTGAVTDPFDDPLFSGILGAGAGLGGAKALNMLRRTGINLASDPDPGIRTAVASKVSDVASAIYQLYPHIQRANYLISSGLPANAFVGPWGAGLFGTLSKMAAGDPRGGAAFREIVNAKTWSKEMFRASSQAQALIERAAAGDPLVRSELHGDILDKVLKGAGALHPTRLYLQGPAILMAAGDIATRNILMRNGFTDEEARIMTMTSEPMLPTLRKILDLRRGMEDRIAGPAMDIMLPFVRTPLNILEQGAQRFPGFGLLLQSKMEKAGYKPTTSMAEKMAQQGISTSILFGSYAIGLATPPEQANTVRRYVSNLGGQYSLVSSLGFAMGQGARKRDTSMAGSLVTPEVINPLEWAVPLPTAEPIGNWLRFIGKMVDDTPRKPGDPLGPPGAVPAVINELLAKNKPKPRQRIVRKRRDR